MNKKVGLHTLGCKLNFSETSTIGNQFLNKGFEIVDFNSFADVYLINTCTVTENAEKECRQLIRRALRNNPNAFIAVTGCYAQLRPDEIANIDGVDLIFGSNEKFNLFSLVESFEKKELACIHVSPTDDLNNFGIAFSSEADSRTRAYLKIQDGCDYNCSFCTIPLARGKSRSLDPQSIISNFKNLISNDYKEIVLTGVNVGDYGKSFDIALSSLLKELIKADGNFRIRISSIEPNLLDDEIIEMTSSSNKICKHFHIPLQSGSPKILKLMQRRYNRNHYEQLIFKLKNRIPDIAIGVDVIVGFPNETEDDFLETKQFLQDLPVSYLHVFTYSERPDTIAKTMANPVAVNERRQRNNILRILSEKKRTEFVNQMLGRTVEVLFEHEISEGMIKGYSSNYIKVSHNYNEDLINNFAQVELQNFDGNFCSGKIKSKKYSVAF